MRILFSFPLNHLVVKFPIDVLLALIQFFLNIW